MKVKENESKPKQKKDFTKVKKIFTAIIFIIYLVASYVASNTVGEFIHNLPIEELQRSINIIFVIAGVIFFIKK